MNLVKKARCRMFFSFIIEKMRFSALFTVFKAGFWKIMDNSKINNFFLMNFQNTYYFFSKCAIIIIVLATIGIWLFHYC